MKQQYIVVVIVEFVEVGERWAQALPLGPDRWI